MSEMSDISINMSDISINMSDISINMSDISINMSDISINMSDISINMSDISINMSDISISVRARAQTHLSTPKRAVTNSLSLYHSSSRNTPAALSSSCSDPSVNGPAPVRAIAA
ncbi:hypothetical protein ACOMHN_000721 [Nucella lapillus]